MEGRLADPLQLIDWGGLETTMDAIVCALEAAPRVHARI
jgi:hypothetical protein